MRFRPAHAHRRTRASSPPLAALLVLVAFLAALALPATGLGATIAAYTGGDRVAGNNTTEGYAAPVAPVTFEYRTDQTGSTWQDLCTVTSGATTCNSDAPGDNTVYVVRVKGTTAPGWNVIREISNNGGNSAAGPTLAYEAVVRTGGPDSTVTALPNRIATGTTTSSITRLHMLRRTNPALPAQCGGYNIVLTLDISSSINAATGSVSGHDKRKAFAASAKAFIDGLAGADVGVRIDTFGTDASAGGSTFRMDATADRNAAKAAIDNIYKPGTSSPSWPTNYTNWDGAIQTANNQNGGKAIVVFTDGNPTRDQGGNAGQDINVGQRNVTFAIAAANKAKADGKRVMAVGAGSGVTVVNLNTLAGPVAEGGPSVFTGDFGPELEKVLAQVANEFCGAKVNIKKLVDGVPASNAWTFTGSGVADGVAYVENPVTTASGVAQLQLNNITASGTPVTITETAQAGITFSGASCRKGSYPSEGDVPTGSPATPAVTIPDVDRNTEWYCTFVNTRDAGALTITKTVTGDVPTGFAQTFTFDISCTKSGDADLNYPNLQIAYPTATTVTKSGIPTGYECAVTEDTPGAVANHTWGTATIGTPVTITKAGTGNIDVTNPLSRDAGALTITKTVTGDVPTGFAQTFTFDISCTKSGDADLNYPNLQIAYPTATTVTKSGIPTGYECAVTEDTPGAVANHTWGTATIGTPVTITKAGTGNIDVTNPLTRDTGKLEVTKVLNPATDPGRFNLSAQGPTPLSATDVGDGGTTGPGGITVDTGEYTVGETAGAGTDLADYTAATVCHARNDANGANLLANGKVTVGRGDDVLCVITNSRIPTPELEPPVVEPPVVTPPVVTPPVVEPPAGEVSATPVPSVVTRTAPRLRITKTGPARARGLQRITYTIRVRNTGRVVARNVVVTDRLPRDLTFVRTSLRSTFRSGTVTVTVGTLRPRQSKVIRVTVRAPADIHGRRVNVATVRATQVRPLTARAATTFRPLVRQVAPAVTG